MVRTSILPAKRGYWRPFCMTVLRELARHSEDLEKPGVRPFPIHVDDQQHAYQLTGIKLDDQQ